MTRFFYTILKICFLVILFAGDFSVQATQIRIDDPVELYKTAEQAYYNQEYPKAEDIFFNLAEECGLGCGQLHYNLGNVYFKMGKLGRALQHYEKALLTLPRDPDLKQNLALAQSKLADVTGETFGDYLLRTFYFWSGWISYFEFQFVFILLTLALWGWCFWRKIRIQPVVTGKFAVLTLIYVYLVFGYHLKCNHSRPGEFGIVLLPELAVKASYLETEKPVFVLHEGTKVRVIDTQNLGPKKNWIKLALPEGQKGWVKENTIGRI